MVRGVLTFAAGACLSAQAIAAPLVVRVTDAAGKPVRDAVVAFYPAGAAARPARTQGHYVVAQRNLQFRPFLTIVPAGADVSFPNFDSTKHHVYSFSAAKRFELKLFAKDQSRTVRFDTPGVVALGCNIHDSMSAFIFVANSAWTGRTDASGVVNFGDAPAAAGRVAVWHPYMRAPSGMVGGAIAATQRTINVAVRLRPPPTPMTMPDY